jgi:hypothetical protein
MAWYEITTAEIAPRQPLDSELFNKIRSNLIMGVACMGLPYIVPNGSFEFSTGTVPSLWDIATLTDGSASIATGVHGANSFKLTHTGSSAGGVKVWTQDYIPVASTAISIHGIVWVSGATSSAITGGVSIKTYNSSYGVIATVSTNHSSYSIAPTTMTMTFSMATNTRFIKVGCILGSASTVAGSIFIDGLYIVNT